ncbi:tRNA pseudouridine(55) synthase TruB [Carnimonas nigrificans]|uniref:tRNA pseudouridine(55) synthase TruB n=1 Tax=Carnimonas nigrificans TaxID=64323 RepID=UPI000470A577|nr:tRNA pseudouridine(55) synthase TruB [Carnimonas nigrificans]
MARRRRGRDIDGVLLLDKPKGLSSNQALGRVRWLYQAAKAGHTGTLDPMATGLLPVCLGEATKFSSFALEADKGYIARVQLGVSTDSGDAEGKVVAEHSLPALSESLLRSTLEAFKGEIEQVPPMFSALKHQGRPLYELAREGKEIKRAPRQVTLYDIALREFDLESGWFDVEVTCSKGTYIRTLAMDIGEKLGCGAHLTALRRIKTGRFDASALLSIEAIEAAGDTRDAWLLPLDCLIDHLPRLDIDAERAARLNLGQQIDAVEGSEPLTVDSTARIYCDERLLGLVTVTAQGLLAPRRLMRSTAT